jgi:hypothetical protein
MAVRSLFFFLLAWFLSQKMSSSFFFLHSFYFFLFLFFPLFLFLVMTEWQSPLGD